MQVTFKLNERDPRHRALLRRLAVGAESRRSWTTAGFPFSLLEALLRLGFTLLERMVAALVDGGVTLLRGLKRALTS